MILFFYTYNLGNQKRKIQVMNELTRSGVELYKYDSKSKFSRQCQTAEYPYGATEKQSNSR